jgi:hypothetical protein
MLLSGCANLVVYPTPILAPSPGFIDVQGIQLNWRCEWEVRLLRF